jgi:hypothetical protein
MTRRGQDQSAQIHDCILGPLVEGDKVFHHVDVSHSEVLTGTDLVRFFKVEGDRLTIASAPSKTLIPGVETTSVLVWEREH